MAGDDFNSVSKETDYANIKIVINIPDVGYEVAVMGPEVLSDKAVSEITEGRGFEGAILTPEILAEIDIEAEEGVTYYDAGAFIDSANTYFNEVRVDTLRLLSSISENTDLSVSHDFEGVDIENLSAVAGTNNISAAISMMTESLDGVLNQKENTYAYDDWPDLMGIVEEARGEMDVAAQIGQLGNSLEVNRTNLLEVPSPREEEPLFTPGVGEKI